MIKKADIVIIGGGIQGCSIAYNLAKKGAKNIVILEKNTCASGSSGRCGAGIRQQFGTKMNCILALESMKTFETLTEELDYDIELNQAGYLLLAYTEKEMRQFKKNVELEQSLGIDAKMVTPKEAKKIVLPLNLEGILGGTFCPTDGNVNPLYTTFAYAEAAQRLGVKYYPFTEVTEIETKNGRILSVTTDKGKILTSTVVNAAGGYSGPVGKMAGIDIPVYSQRHQILITEHIGPMWKPMLMSFSENYYFQQLPDGGILGGYGDPENEVKGSNIDSTWQFARTMAKKMVKLVPILKDVRMVRQWAGLYNMSPDAQPILGEHPKLKGFYLSVGFSGHGFMLAPVTGKLIAELILDGETSIPIDKLDIGRFERGELIHEPSVV